MQRLFSNLLLEPADEKSRISDPTGLRAGLSAEIWIGGLPASTFRLMRLFVGDAAPIGNKARPLMLPPDPFSSMRFSLLEPTSPIPKSFGIPATGGIVAGGPLGAIAPVPANSLRRITFLLLFVMQTPPHGRKPEVAGVRTETTSSTRLLFTEPMKTPLKQFRCEVTFLTWAFSTGSAALPTSPIPCRLIRWTRPG